jgi:hypothetical protein
MPLLEFYPPSLWRIMYILQDDKTFGEIVGEDCRQYKLNAFVSVMRIGRKLDIIDAEYYTEGNKEIFTFAYSAYTNTLCN